MGPGAVIILFLLFGIVVFLMVGFIMGEPYDPLGLHSAGDDGGGLILPTECVGTWSGCSDGSGGGCVKTYSVTTAASNGGTPCPSSDGDTEPCPTEVVAGGDMCEGYVQGSCTNIANYRKCSAGEDNYMAGSEPENCPNYPTTVPSCIDPCVHEDPQILTDSEGIRCNYSYPGREGHPSITGPFPARVTKMNLTIPTADAFAGCSGDDGSCTINDIRTAITNIHTHSICGDGWVPLYIGSGSGSGSTDPNVGRIWTDPDFDHTDTTMTMDNTVCRKMCSCGGVAGSSAPDADHGDRYTHINGSGGFSRDSIYNAEGAYKYMTSYLDRLNQSPLTHIGYNCKTDVDYYGLGNTLYNVNNPTSNITLNPFVDGTIEDTMDCLGTCKTGQDGFVVPQDGTGTGTDTGGKVCRLKCVDEKGDPECEYVPIGSCQEGCPPQAGGATGASGNNACTYPMGSDHELYTKIVNDNGNRFVFDYPLNNGGKCLTETDNKPRTCNSCSLVPQGGCQAGCPGGVGMNQCESKSTFHTELNYGSHPTSCLPS